MQMPRTGICEEFFKINHIFKLFEPFACYL